MKKIVVTGSSGFIGFYLSKKLLETGFKVIGIDNHSDYYNVALKKYRLSILEKFCNFEFLNKDINNLEKLSEECDLAINLAAQAGVRVDPEKEYLYREANVKGFEAFCNFFINKRIKRIIYASSSSVYSDAGFEKFNESKTELKPRSAYGMSKLLNEKFAEEIVSRKNISMIGLRFFSVYGPMGRPDMAYYLFTNAIKNDVAINLNSNGQMARDMTLFVDDDDKAYHIYSSEDNSTLHISQLSEDYLTHSGKYKRFFPSKFNEAPTMMKTSSGKYFIISSGCTGWNPNAARSASAQSIFGPWKELGNPCVSKDSLTTYYSQSTYILPVQGSKDAYIFMADRWKPENPIEGKYIWLPLKIKDDKLVELEWKENWDLSIFNN